MMDAPRTLILILIRSQAMALACLLLMLSPIGATAQEAGAQSIALKPSGRAYLDAVRYRGIETDVGYYDPTRAVPRLETGQNPAPPRPAANPVRSFSTGRKVVIVLAAVVLIGLAVAVLRWSGNMTLSLQGAAQNPGRARRAAARGDLALVGPPADLATILATADRRRALVMLARGALARAVTAQGVLLQPSWTLRDALARVPTGHRHLAALRPLVMAGELVLFGDRDVTEAEFQAQVAGIAPLMRGAMP